MKLRRWLPLGIVGALLTISGALWATWHGTGSAGRAGQEEFSSSQRSSASTAVSVALPGQASAWQRSWEPGLQYVYVLTLQQRFAFRPAQTSPPATAPAALQAQLEGNLVQTVSDTLGDQVILQYALQPRSFALESGGQDAVPGGARAAMLRALQTPFYVTFNRQGAALDIHVERTVDAVSQSFLRTLIASLQVVLPPSARREWQSQELDATGHFTADYHQLAAPRDFEKRRLRYMGLGSPTGLQRISAETRVTPTGSTRLTLDERLWLQTLSGTERLEIVPGEGLPAIVGEVQVQARRTEQRTAPDRVGAFATNRSRLVSAGLAVQVVAPEPVEARLRRLLDGKTFSSLVAELRASSDEQADGSKTARAMEQLRALFLLEPDRAAAVPALLRAERARSVYSPLIGALSGASTAEAVAALAQISTDETLPRPMRVDAIAGLGVVEKPSKGGLGELQRLAQAKDDEIRSTATLALGSTARNLSANGDDTAGRVIDDFSTALQSSADPEQKVLQLKALANTADNRAIPLIQQALRSDSPQVRAAAVSALRIIPDSEADRLLAAQLLGDPSVDVRRGAVFASSFRPLEPLLPSLAQAIQTETSSSVRLDIVRLIGENGDRLQTAGALLSQVSRSDPDPRIRDAASRFLAASSR